MNCSGGIELTDYQGVLRKLLVEAFGIRAFEVEVDSLGRDYKTQYEYH